MSEKLDASKSNGAHHQLSRLAGEWEGTTRVWFQPDKVEDESAIRGTMQLVLGGRFILHEYTGSFKNKPLSGIAIFGYHLALGKFQSAWVDSYHNGTAIMFSEGKRDHNAFSVLGSYAYVTPELEQYWGWRTDVELLDTDEIRITAYNISPEGEEVKATETNYRRVK